MGRRRPLIVVALTLVTLGIYGVYWFYTTSRDMITVSGRDSHSVLWTLGLFVPMIDLLVLWRFSRTYSSITGAQKPLPVFLLWLVFFPAAQYVVQKGLNTAAGDATNPVRP